MKLRVLTCLTIFALIFGTSCHRESSNKLLQEKGKSQTAVLQLLQQIDSLGVLGEYNPAIIKNYIAKAEEFGNRYPEDPMSAELLYKAGLLAMRIAQAQAFENPEETKFYAQRALTIFDNIQKVYPDFNGVKNCIFYKGVIYDDILHDYENAELLYRAFIARYPTDTLAINLESYLQHLGKTPEEIMLEFDKK
jgi:hypothetical protein